MRSTALWLRASAGLLGILAGVACSGPKPAASGQGQPLWGELTPIVSVKELMRDMLDPASDNIFNSVRFDITHDQIIETSPKTDADWEKIRIGAVTLAEGADLLKVPRPFAPPGDENNSTGPDPGELSPSQIRARLEADPVLWNAKIQALRNVGLEVLEIVKKRDANELWDAGENLDTACETCHLAFWYPNEAALMARLDRRLEELYGVRADRTGRGSTPLGMYPKKP